jgi:peptidoglycan hydrolase CwlO-like protein
MKRPSDLKADIAKIKKLKALQQKATDKLDKITADAKAGKKKSAPAKRSAAKTRPAAKKKPAPRKKNKSAAKKSSFWSKLFGMKQKR